MNVLHSLISWNLITKHFPHPDWGVNNFQSTHVQHVSYVPYYFSSAMGFLGMGAHCQAILVLT